jgi:DNA-binding transcriptional LysR family regulator
MAGLHESWIKIVAEALQRALSAVHYRLKDFEQRPHTRLLTRTTLKINLTSSGE